MGPSPGGQLCHCIHLLSDYAKWPHAKIANDALTRYIYTGKVTIGQIEYALIFMNAKLRTTIGRVKNHHPCKNHVASEIATGNILIERTENQASSLEETSSMENHLYRTA